MFETLFSRCYKISACCVGTAALAGVSGESRCRARLLTRHWSRSLQNSTDFAFLCNVRNDRHMQRVSFGPCALRLRVHLVGIDEQTA